MAGVLDVCSNHCIANFNPGQLKKLAVPGDRAKGSSKTASYRAQSLSKRLTPETIADIVRRSRAGGSARSLAKEYEVAPSALVRLLREHGAVVAKRKVSADEEQTMAREYEAGATMRELEKRFRLSHGTVLRALHRSGVEMRAKAPRRKN